MPSKLDKVALGDSFLKRSAKLLPCQKEMIPIMYNRCNSMRKVARMFNVSKRTIEFIVYPERAKANYQKRVENGGSKVYYNREQHTKCIASIRKYKKNIFEKTDK